MPPTTWFHVKFQMTITLARLCFFSLSNEFLQLLTIMTRMFIDPAMPKFFHLNIHEMNFL